MSQRYRLVLIRKNLFRSFILKQNEFTWNYDDKLLLIQNLNWYIYIWMVIGLIIYMLYGKNKSNLAKNINK